MNTFSFRLIPLLLISFSLQSEPMPDWRTLFNGHSLDGWRIVEGNSSVLVDDGKLLAINQDRERNTYLITEQEYGDFILEFEFKLIGDLDSGTLIRGHYHPDMADGKPTGYQMEIDQSDRKWTGGIYETGGRGWLSSLECKDAAMAAFKKNQWNHYRIEAIGSAFRIWVNGIPTLNMVDSKTAKGVIGFQIHRVTPNKPSGAFFLRNIHILTDGLEAHARESEMSVVRINPE